MNEFNPDDQKENRSGGLLPAGEDDDNNEDNSDRYEVAEEVNLDQQSDRTRHLGNLPADEDVEGETAAVAESLKPK